MFCMCVDQASARKLVLYTRLHKLAPRSEGRYGTYIGPSPPPPNTSYLVGSSIPTLRVASFCKGREIQAIGCPLSSMMPDRPV